MVCVYVCMCVLHLPWRCNINSLYHSSMHRHTHITANVKIDRQARENLFSPASFSMALLPTRIVFSRRLKFREGKKFQRESWQDEKWLPLRHEAGSVAPPTNVTGGSGFSHLPFSLSCSFVPSQVYYRMV